MIMILFVNILLLLFILLLVVVVEVVVVVIYRKCSHSKSVCTRGALTKKSHPCWAARKWTDQKSSRLTHRFIIQITLGSYQHKLAAKETSATFCSKLQSLVRKRDYNFEKSWNSVLLHILMQIGCAWEASNQSIRGINCIMHSCFLESMTCLCY